METSNTPAEGGSYEIINGERVLVARTEGEGKRGTTDVCPALDPAEMESLEVDAAEAAVRATWARADAATAAGAQTEQ